MANLSTVKEVCDLTGLNRKLLYDYKEEKIVVPSGYANAGFDDQDGYKLYDEAAVLKLQQIAIFRKLGMKRSEIKEKMKDEDYDSNAILDEQLELLNRKKKEIEDMIVVAEQLKLLGMKNNLISYFSKSSFGEIIERNDRWIQSDYYKQLVEKIQDNSDSFEQLYERFFEWVENNIDTKINSDEVYSAMQEQFKEFSGLLGFAGTIMLAFIGIAGKNDGTLINEMFEEVNPKEIQYAEKAIELYARRRTDEMLDEVVDIIVDNIDIIGADYSDPLVSLLYERLKQLCTDYLGITQDEEYQAIFELLPKDFFCGYDKVHYLVDVVRHFTKKTEEGGR